MKRSDVYIDLDGHEFALAGLDPEERRLVARLRRRARANPEWDTFDNYWTVAVRAFYKDRGLSATAVLRTIPWRIAQDLSSRLGIAAGTIRPPDYRDQLEDLILNHFPSRRAFCQATGLSPTMLSHVLAGRKDLSLAALTQALQHIGYQVRITPAVEQKRTG
jgi:hypothetical protein